MRFLGLWGFKGLGLGVEGLGLGVWGFRVWEFAGGKVLHCIFPAVAKRVL